MSAAKKPYAAPLTMSTAGRRTTAKTPAVYYTYDQHGDRIEIPVYRPAARAVTEAAQIAMPIGLGLPGGAR